MTSSKPISLLKAPSPNAIALEVRAPACKFEGQTVQSVAGTLRCQAGGPTSLMLWGGWGSLQVGDAGRESPRRTQWQPEARRLFPRAGDAEGKSTVDWRSSGVLRSWRTRSVSFLEDNPGLRKLSGGEEKRGRQRERANLSCWVNEWA